MMLRKVALWIVCLLIGGCEFNASCNTKTLDRKGAEKLVKGAVAAQTGGDPKVTCPGGIKIEKGGRFDCKIEIDGVNGVATLEQKDDKTYVEVVSVTGLLFGKTLERTLSERLTAQTEGKVTVACGATVRASTPGDTFRCQATDAAGATIDVVVKVKDDAGNIDYELDKASIKQGATPPVAPAPEAAPPAPPATE